MKTNLRGIGGVALLLVGLGLLAAGVARFFMSDQFKATARVRVENDSYFIQTEFEVIWSQVILHRVIENLGLNELWAKRYGAVEKLNTAETYVLLKRQVDLRAIPHSDLIEIRLSSDKPEEAARIANEITIVYRDYRLAQKRDLLRGSVNALKETVQAHEKKIKEAQENVDRLREELKSDGTDPDDPASNLTLESEPVRRLVTEQIEVQAQYAKEKNVIDQLKKLNREQRNAAIPSIGADVLLGSLSVQLAKAETDLAAARRNYLAASPDVQKAAAAVDELNRKTNERVDAIMADLETRLKSLEARADNLSVEMANAKQMEVQRATKRRPYFEAKRQLEELRRFEEVLKQKFASEHIDAQLPEASSVEIVDKAEPPLRPATRNSIAGVSLLALGALVSIGGLVLLISGMASKSRPETGDPASVFTSKS